MKENEIYAPNYNNGERVVLIRYPHGGIFEIPELTVNNKHKGANETIKQARDAVGINSKVAEKLSGADFDGDTVLVIPNDKGLIKTAPSLKGLLNFDAKLQYKAYPGMPKMGENTMPKLMGDVSNLITDMTIKGATNDELARAVRHSMVVIDAKKHNLNYKQSAIDNRIAELKKIYQGKENAGAATLISRASSETRVPYREEGKWVEDPTTGKKKRMYVDPTTGEKLYEYTGKTYTKGKKIIDPLTGKKKTIYIDPNTNKPFEDLKVENTLSKSTKMAEAKDAFELSSGTPMETIYANHANKLKAMANEARKTALTIKPPLQSPTARVTYKKEVDELNAALNIAIRNKPLERQAHIIGNIVVKEKMAKYPDMEPGDLKKIKSQALMEARTRTKADKSIITLTERQWEAIQAHAVSANILKQILDNADMDVVRRLATPRKQEELTASVKTQIRRRIEAGYTQSEVANSLGLSTSTITKVMG
jgi:hypothetical protein